MIAFLGLGRMGAPMAARLAAAGHDVTVWNRTPGRAEVPKARVAPSPAAAVAGADLVITMLSDPAAVLQVTSELAEALRPGAVVIEMSTIGPDAVATLRSRLPAEVGLVDAPVVGSVEPAATGKLRILAGGTDDEVARCRAVLSVLGSVHHVGPLGSGAAMKLAVMSVIVPIRVLAAETRAYCAAMDLDRDAFLGILADSGIRVPARETTPTRYALAHAAKDLALATAGSEVLSLAATANSRLRSAQRAGLGDRDLTAIFDHLLEAHMTEPIEKLNPPSVPPPAGPYTHAVRVGDLLFVSGQVALDSDGAVVGEGDMVRQSEYVFDVLGKILASQGLTFDDVVNIRTFLTDMSMRQQYGQVRARYITGTPPSSTTVEVSRLFRPGLLIEAEVVAAYRRAA